MATDMSSNLERVLQRAEALMQRIESVLPQPLEAPDWSASVAYRYRKRSSGRCYACGNDKPHSHSNPALLRVAAKPTRCAASKLQHVGARVLNY